MSRWLLLFMLLSGDVYAQAKPEKLRIVFYNTENLFDPFDDSLTSDEEFLPGSIRNWTWERYLEKEKRIYKVLASVGEWEAPAIIGLCEVENRFVLERLTRKTPLAKYNYKIIHRDSPDERGIDVAMLYLPGKFMPGDWKYFPVEGLSDPTREILYVSGMVPGGDSLHLVLCHWPSRWKGYLESMPARILAARTVNRILDSIRAADPAARIILAGDMNDEISDPSISETLRVRILDRTGQREVSNNILEKFAQYPDCDTCLYHVMRGSEAGTPGGTLKYRGRWYEYDHIFMSASLLAGQSLQAGSQGRQICHPDYLLEADSGGKQICHPDYLLEADPGGKQIYHPSFLLETDPVYGGLRPFRTCNGYQYLGGFSDHLPVYIDLLLYPGAKNPL